MADVTFDSTSLEAGLDIDQIELIEEVQGEAMIAIAEGRSNYPGMTYEQGIHDALAWLTGDREEPPLPDVE